MYVVIQSLKKSMTVNTGCEIPIQLKSIVGTGLAAFDAEITGCLFP